MVATDQGDRGPEEQALEDPHQEVEGIDVFPRVFPVVVVVDAQQHVRVEVAAQHAHEVGHHGERGDEHEAAQETGHHQVIDGVGPHALQGVDLFGDTHGAQFRRHGAAHAAGEHRGRQHRPQFTDQGQVDHRSEPRLQAEGLELPVALHGQHHADEQPGEGHDRQRHDPDLVEGGDEHLAPLSAGEDPTQRAQRKQSDVADAGDGGHGELAEVGHLADEPSGDAGGRCGADGGRGHGDSTAGRVGDSAERIGHAGRAA